jgi:hypothetical protein
MLEEGRCEQIGPAKPMNAKQPLQRDEPAAAVEHAGSKWAYHFLFTYVVPRIAIADLPALLAVTLAGALVAGCYGAVHDQITFSIGPEYFRNFKFRLFSYADLGLGERVFVSLIGFLATWWVGAIGGWILARRILSTCSQRTAYRRICAGFSIVFVAAASAGLLGYLYGLWRGPNADYSAWQPTLQHYRVSDAWPFMRVGYIHNAGYIGGLVGLLLTYVAIRPGTLRDRDGTQQDEAPQ